MGAAAGLVAGEACAARASFARLVGSGTSAPLGARDGCLFNIFLDPTERTSLALANQSLFEEMLAAVDALQATASYVYSPDRGRNDPRACHVAREVNGGYWGPFAT